MGGSRSVVRAGRDRNDRVTHLVDPASVRRAYMENLEKYEEDMTIGCRRNRIDIVKLVTDEPYAEALSKYLAYRMR